MKFFDSFIRESFIELPKNVWICKNNKFFYSGERELELPTIPAGYEWLINLGNAKYMHIPGGEPGQGEQCAVWDSQIYFEEELELPAWKELRNGKFLKIRNHKEWVLTKETIEAAKRKKREIEYLIEEYYELKQLKKELSGNQWALIYMKYIFRCEDYRKGEDHVKVFPVQYELYPRNNDRSNWHIIFDMNQIKPNSRIKLKVPKKIRGLVVGVGGWQLTNWTKKLGVQGIDVL